MCRHRQNISCVGVYQSLLFIDIHRVVFFFTNTQKSYQNERNWRVSNLYHKKVFLLMVNFIYLNTHWNNAELNHASITFLLFYYYTSTCLLLLIYMCFIFLLLALYITIASDILHNIYWLGSCVYYQLKLHFRDP